MTSIGLGIHLWAQNTDWASYLAAARLVDRLGYDHLWTWDHLISAVGDTDRPVFEGYTTLAAWAMATERVRLGLMVGANTFRNPAVLAKTVSTLDHISGGRAILGLGSGWHVREHEAFGLEFGSGFGERLDWLEEALSIVRPLLGGEEVDHVGPHYRVERLRLVPPPVQDRVPIMVGGVGERKTLRSVARHADMWNAQSPLAEAPHKLQVLRDHPGERGLVTAISGMITKQGVSIWATEPPAAGYRYDDVSKAAAAATGSVPVVDAGEAGVGSVLTYTVTADAEGPSRSIALVDLGDGRRALAISDDRPLAQVLVATDVVGARAAVAADGSFALA